MKLKTLPLLIALSASSADAATVLIQNDFDGVADDTGPAFKQITNDTVAGTRGSAITGTGVISISSLTSGNANAAYGFNNGSTVDVTGVSGATGFTMEWVVTGGANLKPHPSQTNSAGEGIAFNGWFFGVTNTSFSNTTELYNTATERLGVLMINGAFQLSQVGGSTALGVTPSQASLEDGFTLNMTFLNDNTYLITSSGLSDNFNHSGTLNAAGTQYAEIAGGLVASTSVQGDNVSYTIDSVTLTAIPEPATALLGGLGLLALFRRRRS